MKGYTLLTGASAKMTPVVKDLCRIYSRMETRLTYYEMEMLRAQEKYRPTQR
jgi:hypothetical protein